MIPEFNEHGNLPPGIHTARLLEVVARFGRQSELRRVQAESLAWLVELAGKAGVTRIVINGSFVTARLEPNDVDCALLIGAGYPADKAAAAELASGLPFLDLQIVGQRQFDRLVGHFFGTDRHGDAKGVVEVLL